MYSTIELTEKNIASFETGTETIAREQSVPQLSIHIMMGMAAAVGVWATTCLISGLAGANTLQELGRGLVTALIGI
jgi:hypothetical protein